MVPKCVKVNFGNWNPARWVNSGFWLGGGGGQFAPPYPYKWLSCILSSYDVSNFLTNFTKEILLREFWVSSYSNQVYTFYHNFRANCPIELSKPSSIHTIVTDNLTLFQTMMALFRTKLALFRTSLALLRTKLALFRTTLAPLKSTLALSDMAN